MDRDDVNWHGYWPASPTPFRRDGSFDELAFRAVLRLYVEQGMHGVLVNGSSGEWFSQTAEERKRVCEIAVAEVGAAFPVVVGCTSLSLDEVTTLGQHASSAGAAGVMVAPPPYVRLGDDEVVAFYQRVAQTVRLPVMVYNIPRRIGIDIGPELASRLADVPFVVALKNSVPDEAFFATLERVAGRMRVFGGNFFSPIGIAALRHVGGDGYIGGWELLGADAPRFFDSYWSGDYPTATSIAARERSLDRELWDARNNPTFGTSFQSQLKAALNLTGMPAGYPRRPLLPLDDPAKLEMLAELLKRHKVPLQRTGPPAAGASPEQKAST